MSQQATADAFDPFALESQEEEFPLPGASTSQDAAKEDGVFDPFGLGRFPSLGDDVSSSDSPKPPPQVTRFTRTPDDALPAQHSSQSEAKKPTSKKGGSMALPPKVVVRFSVHEEVSSVAKPDSDEGASDISVEGILQAQVQSSDARKNSPFALVASSSQGENLVFRGTEGYVRAPAEPALQSIPSQALHIVSVPKSEFAHVTIGKYTLSEEVRHMPILVERKTTYYGKTCRVMVQVRSKLTNLGDMTDFTIAVAVPERVNGDTIEITRGDGVWDDLKRTIKWKMPVLPRGESVMICAQAQLWAPVEDEADQPRFPVLLRCSSAHDHISSAQFRAGDAEGYPANVAYSRKSSFRLLHRLV